ncbi:MAG: DUF350 domain-containing protein [Chitinophagales bacterium]|jgi:uncharacterized membrane protein YjfL (UPF0719 family)|nr:DUF350 domain-containing protein [Chitinophagales bacterium]HNI44635.1 DUF350 domain-containing protein [Chitinophagales bacterium]HNL07818.1 DUF350 domain-containing protein [Chitinophagales bacterium]
MIPIIPMLNALCFALVGIVVLLISYWLMEKLTPEKTWHEIVHNQNVALAIVMASLILAMGMIISAAVHG